MDKLGFLLLLGTILDMFEPHFLQNDEALLLTAPQSSQIFLRLFFFSSSNVILKKPCSIFTKSSRTLAISSLRLPVSLRRQRTARARSLKNSSSISSVRSNISLFSVSEMTVFRFTRVSPFFVSCTFKLKGSCWELICLDSRVCSHGYFIYPQCVSYYHIIGKWLCKILTKE